MGKFKVGDIVMIVDEGQGYWPAIARSRFGCWGVVTHDDGVGLYRYNVESVDWDGTYDHGSVYAARELEVLDVSAS